MSITSTVELNSKPLATAKAKAAGDGWIALTGPILQARIQAAGFSINRLAKTTHIPRTTLRRQLGKPESFKVDNFFAVATVLGTKPSTIIAEAEQAERDAGMSD